MSGEELCIEKGYAQDLYSLGEKTVVYLQDAIAHNKQMGCDTTGLEKQLRKIRLEMRSVRDSVRG